MSTCQSGGSKHVKTRGSRAEVFHGTAKKTAGGLTKKHLQKNKRGRIVSIKKSKSAKKNKFLEKAGFKPKKGKFTLFSKAKKGKKGKRTRKQRGGQDDPEDPTTKDFEEENKAMMGPQEEDPMRRDPE